MRGENDRRVPPTWVQRFVNTSDHAEYTQANNHHHTPFEDHSVDILWLSPTEYVSFYPFHCSSADLFQYSVTIWLRSKLSLRLYPQSMPWLTERSVSAGPSPELPLQFLGEIIMPSLKEVVEIKLEATLWGPWPANASVFLIVPSREQELSNNIRVSIEGSRHNLVRSFATFPCHPKVCLSVVHPVTDIAHILNDDADFDPEALNDILLQFQGTPQLQIPALLLEHECANRSFTTNGSFSSLTINLDDVGEFPSAVFEGIAGNPSITRLTIILASQSFRGNTAVLPLIGAGFGTVKTLSFELFWKPFPVGRASNEEKSPQQMFDVLCGHMCVKFCIGHGYSQISFIDGYSQNDAMIKSNPACDSSMSPALLLNWLREQELSLKRIRLLS
jgi:hypothetical protein